jgi:hypothetical protein
VREVVHNHGNGEVFAERKTVTIVSPNQDNSFSVLSSSSSGSKGSDVYIADALRRRAFFFTGNEQDRSNSSSGGVDIFGEERKSSLPTLHKVSVEAEKKMSHSCNNGNGTSGCLEAEKCRLPSAEAERR